MSSTTYSLEGQNRHATALSKVPQITIFFWITKLLTTAMGEAASDFFVNLSEVGAVVCAAAALAASLILQLSVSQYIPWVYWLVVAMVAVFGTMAADMLHHVAGVPLPVSTLTFGVLLAVVFAVWYAVERTLSIHMIFSRRREAFYWLTVFVSFAFGTAAGDWTAISLHLGTLVSGFLFAVLFAIPIIGSIRLGWNEVFAFWFAYVMTRPLGASFADWFGDPVSHGGVGCGKGTVAIVLTILIVLFVRYLTVSRVDVEKKAV